MKEERRKNLATRHSRALQLSSAVVKYCLHLKMIRGSKQWLDGYVFALSEENYSYSVIKKRCENHGIRISKCKISNIINNRGKKRESLLLSGKKWKNEYPRKIRTSSNISKIKHFVSKENPSSQRSIAKCLKIRNHRKQGHKQRFKYEKN